MRGRKDFFIKDFWIKAFSLVFAIFLWMSIVGGESAEEFFVVPLSIKNIPENMIISNDIVDFVNVRVRGQRGVLNSLNTKQIDVVLDMKDAEEGENTITIFPEETKLPDGATAVRVSPSQFRIELSRLAEKSLKVAPIFLGAPASGYQLGKVRCSPPEVVVMGLEEVLKDQGEIETRHLELFGRNGSFEQEVELKPLNANVYIKGPQKVRVHVEIVAKIGQREIKNIPVVQGHVEKEGVKIKPERVSLLLEGPEAALAQFSPAMVQVFLPEQEGEGTFDVKPEVILPKGFRVLQVTPETIEVKIP